MSTHRTEGTSIWKITHQKHPLQDHLKQPKLKTVTTLNWKTPLLPVHNPTEATPEQPPELRNITKAAKVCKVHSNNPNPCYLTPCPFPMMTARTKQHLPKFYHLLSPREKYLMNQSLCPSATVRSHHQPCMI